MSTNFTVNELHWSFFERSGVVLDSDDDHDDDELYLEVLFNAEEMVAAGMEAESARNAASSSSEYESETPEEGEGNFSSVILFCQNTWWVSLNIAKLKIDALLRFKLLRDHSKSYWSSVSVRLHLVTSKKPSFLSSMWRSPWSWLWGCELPSFHLRMYWCSNMED